MGAGFHHHNKSHIPLVSEYQIYIPNMILYYQFRRGCMIHSLREVVEYLSL
jgi:hypothetical protein